MSSQSSAATGNASRGIFRLFTDRKIATKIAIGFAAVLAITAVISVMAYLSFGKVATGIAEYTRLGDVVGNARDVDRDFLALRRYVREYAFTGEEENAKIAGVRHKQLNDAIANSLKVIKNPERRAKIEHARDQLAVYAKDFDKLILLRREQIKLTKEVLDPSGLKLRTDIEQLQNWAVSKAGNSNIMVLAGEALKQLMQARLSVNKLLGRHDQAAANDAEKAFKDMKTALAAFDASIANAEVRKLFDEVKMLADKYHDGYVRAADVSHQIEELMNGEMVKIADVIAADAAAVKETGIAEEQAIEHETYNLISNTERIVLVFAAAGLVLGALLAWLIGRAISVPTRAIGVVLVELSNGNKAVDVPYADRGDEVGDNARAAKTFKENLLRIEKMEAEQKEAEARAAAERRSTEEREAAAQKAAEEKAAADRKAAMQKLADEFERAVGNIVETVSSASTELEAAANTLTKTAETTQDLSAVVAAASEEASTNVQSVASATEEMTGSVHEISRQVQESSNIAAEAVKQAEKTDARINELSHAAQRIGDVVKLITSVAEQTNLLALNATIEAARAGEAGKGFAVVAQEVKALAAQTAKATDEIGAQISGMQTATQESVAAIKEIGGTIRRISEIAATIAAAVEEQGAATQEISRNVQEAAKGTAQVASNIISVNRGAGETGSASSQVLASAQSLSSESNHLKIEVQKFLQTVRTA